MTAAERPPRFGADDRVRLGRLGEAAAERFLRTLGFRILQRRFRTRRGEVDLIALEGGTLVFVEVKTRRTPGCGAPSEAVGGLKRSRILRAARVYLAGLPGPERPCRFDVVEVYEEVPGRLRPRLIRDAFQAL